MTSFFFFVGGLFAMLMRAELAQPGRQFVDPNTFNGLFSVHASLLIFLFIIPVFAGLANFVLPLMIGAPDMAFPRLNALSFWMLPLAGIMMLMSFGAPGGSFASGWTAYAPLSVTAPEGQVFFTIGVQFAGASSIATALNFLVTIITMRAPGMSFACRCSCGRTSRRRCSSSSRRRSSRSRSSWSSSTDRWASTSSSPAGVGDGADVSAHLLVLLDPAVYAYALTITDIDPAAFPPCFFERFLNEDQMRVDA